MLPVLSNSVNGDQRAIGRDFIRMFSEMVSLFGIHQMTIEDRIPNFHKYTDCPGVVSWIGL